MSVPRIGRGRGGIPGIVRESQATFQPPTIVSPGNFFPVNQPQILLIALPSASSFAAPLAGFSRLFRLPPAFSWWFRLPNQFLPAGFSRLSKPLGMAVVDFQQQSSDGGGVDAAAVATPKVVGVEAAGQSARSNSYMAVLTTSFPRRRTASAARS